MRNLTKSYSRTYYYKIAKIRLRLWFDLLRVFIVKQLFHLAYKIDANLCEELTGRKLR